MIDRITLRPAQPQDFAFSKRLYFENMCWIIAALNLDMARQHEAFASQWRLAKVRVIVVAGADVGWLQTTTADDAIFLSQLYLAKSLQAQGIGSYVVQHLIDKATVDRKAITLGVVKVTPLGDSTSD